MPLTAAEVEAIRVHLGHGALKLANAYTADGFWEVFHQIVAPNLDERESTTATTAVASAGNATVTVAALDGIVPHARLVVDVGDDAETVVVRSVSGSAFSARFAKAHPVGTPVQVESGVARCRLLLHAANRAWEKLQASSITQSAGIKQLGKGQIEWFGGGTVLAETANHFLAITDQLSHLVRVKSLWRDGLAAKRSSSTLEPY